MLFLSQGRGASTATFSCAKGQLRELGRTIVVRRKRGNAVLKDKNCLRVGILDAAQSHSSRIWSPRKRRAMSFCRRFATRMNRWSGGSEGSTMPKASISTMTRCWPTPTSMQLLSRRPMHSMSQHRSRLLPLESMCFAKSQSASPWRRSRTWPVRCQQAALNASGRTHAPLRSWH